MRDIVIYTSILAIICALGWGALYTGSYLAEREMQRKIAASCKELSAFVLDGKFYSCEPKEWNYSNIQEW